MSAIEHLIAEAAALAGGNLCATEHAWKAVGGRACPHDGACSQTVYVCDRCAEYDYGEPGGPAYAECFSGFRRCDGTLW